VSDEEFIEWWNECRWDKTGTELDAWPREKLAEIARLRDALEQVACADALCDAHFLVHNALKEGK
jgi:hypothetical protein